MTFQTQLSIGTSNVPGVWINTDVKYFNNPIETLLYYANNFPPDGFLELIEGKDDFELQCKMGEKILQYQDINYLNNNVYPNLI